jgi:hypothetical protein
VAGLDDERLAACDLRRLESGCAAGDVLRVLDSQQRLLDAVFDEMKRRRLQDRETTARLDGIQAELADFRAELLDAAHADVEADERDGWPRPLTRAMVHRLRAGSAFADVFVAR